MYSIGSLVNILLCSYKWNLFMITSYLSREIQVNGGSTKLGLIDANPKSSYGCNACNNHRNKQQEHPHTQNVTFVTVPKETNQLRKSFSNFCNDIPNAKAKPHESRLLSLDCIGLLSRDSLGTEEDRKQRVLTINYKY